MQSLRKNLTTIIIIAVTVILAGVALFTALRLYQLRQTSVAPNVPSSQPGAAAPGQIQKTPASPTTTICSGNAVVDGLGAGTGGNLYSYDCANISVDGTPATRTASCTDVPADFPAHRGGNSICPTNMFMVGVTPSSSAGGRPVSVRCCGYAAGNTPLNNAGEIGRAHV